MRVAGAVVVIAVLEGGSGIGLARRFSAAGAGMLIADQRPGVAEDLATELDRPGCPVVGVSGDARQPSDVAALVATAAKHLGPIDLFCVAAPTANASSRSPNSPTTSTRWPSSSPRSATPSARSFRVSGACTFPTELRKTGARGTARRSGVRGKMQSA
ncbi:SDR family NAD(P)-dependent oxidoreductase [Kitasatospora gansuensis]